MSMSLSNAKTYVARIIGGAGNTAVLAMAAEAINRAYEDWQHEKNWFFLLKDTSVNTVVTGCTATAASAVVNAPSTGAFDFVNAGQTVTIAAADTATLAADTTVSSVTRGTNGVVSSITLSNAFGGTTDTSSTLTFTADIPLVQGTDDYALPNDCASIYTARITTNSKNPLKFIEHRRWDRITNDQTVQGACEFYTVYNPYGPLTQNYGTQRIKLFRVPQQSDTLRIRYFRNFDKTADPIDIPDEYLYKFLDYARFLLLEVKRAQDDPATYMQSVKASFAQAVTADEELADDDFGDSVLKPGTEYIQERLPWANGQFDPTP